MLKEMMNNYQIDQIIQPGQKAGLWACQIFLLLSLF